MLPDFPLVRDNILGGPVSFHRHHRQRPLVFPDGSDGPILEGEEEGILVAICGSCRLPFLSPGPSRCW